MTKKPVPLAERLRPQSLGEVVGQRHLIGAGKPLSRMVEKSQLYSMIFWGPPGTGKTTIAHILAKSCGMPFVSLSAIFQVLRILEKFLKGLKKPSKKESQLSCLWMKFIDLIALNKIAFYPMSKKESLRSWERQQKILPLN